MKIAIYILIAWGMSATILEASDTIEKISLAPTADIQRAVLYVWKEIKNPEAILILCPGYNGSGENLVRQPIWQDFARNHKLGLVGLSFASNGEPFENKRGYYYAAEGSGDLLLIGLKKIYGQNLPLLLYGFSGGAHFVSRFEEWSPDKVIAWCAYSAAWWDAPKQSRVNPPGIIACGDQDERYGASMMYFKQGRAAGKPWLWISVPKTGHSPLPAVENFIRDYFRVVLEKKNLDGIWVDIDRETEAKSEDLEHTPSITGWMPNRSLFDKWKTIHEP